MAVVGVLAVAQIRDHEHLGQLALDGANRALHDPARIVGRAGDGVLEIGDAEQQDRADPERLEFAALGHDAVNGKPEDARHARNLAFRLAVVGHEERLHEARDAHLVFAHQRAQRRVRADAARPLGEIDRGSRPEQLADAHRS